MMSIEKLLAVKKDMFRGLLYDAEKLSKEHRDNIKKIMEMPESKSLLVWLLFLNKELKRNHESDVNYMYMAEGVYKAYMSLLAAKNTDMALEMTQLEEYFLNVFSDYFDAVLGQLKVNLSIREK